MSRQLPITGLSIPIIRQFGAGGRAVVGGFSCAAHLLVGGRNRAPAALGGTTVSDVYCPQGLINSRGPLLWACWEENPFRDQRDWALIAADSDVHDEDLVIIDSSDYLVLRGQDPHHAA